MVLSDHSIREEIAAGRIVVDPFVDDMVQPCSIDVTVGDSFRVFRNSRYPYIDVKREMEDLTELVRVGRDEPFILHPGEFVLGVVAERVALPDDIVATLDGKSSLGRLGLVVHQTAGVIDAGFDGHITLELANMANLPITVYPGMRIAQLSFLTLSTPADHPYGSSKLGSKYQGQAEPTPSRYYLNFAERPGGCWLPAAPATSVPRWSHRWRRPGTRCGCSCTNPSRPCRRRPRPYGATSPTRRRWRRRPPDATRS
jgi:dCTP deaminase